MDAQASLKRHWTLSGMESDNILPLMKGFERFVLSNVESFIMIFDQFLFVTHRYLL